MRAVDKQQQSAALVGAVRATHIGEDQRIQQQDSLSNASAQ